MSTAAPPASFTRWKGAVLVAAAFAAGAATVYLGSAYSASRRLPPQPLSRRNALYRRRPREGPNPSDSADDTAAAAAAATTTSDEPVELANGSGPHIRSDDALTDVGVPEDDPEAEAEGQQLHELMFAIAKNRARTEGFVHRAITCDSCRRTPIVGIRYRCANCPDYDLCEDCEAQDDRHPKTHVFYKIRVPAPWACKVPEHSWYPGAPHLLPRELPQSLRTRLCEELSLQTHTIEAYYVQFTCIANTEWPEDPSRLGAGIDWDAFSTCFVPRAAAGAQVNLIFRRVFSLFDRDRNGLISFDEFARTLVALFAGRSHTDHQFIFDAFDADDDGFISRADCLRMYRAYFALDKDMILDRYRMDMAGEPFEELEERRGPADFIKGGRPLTSYFEGPYQQFAVVNNAGRDKGVDRFGDLVPTSPGQESMVIRPEATLSNEDIIRGSWSWPDDGALASARYDWDQELERLKHHQSPRFLLRHSTDQEVYVEHMIDPPQKYCFRTRFGRHFMFVEVVRTGDDDKSYRCIFVQVPVQDAEQARANPETDYLRIVNEARDRLDRKIRHRREEEANAKLWKRRDLNAFYPPNESGSELQGQSIYTSTYGAHADRLCLDTDMEALETIQKVLEEGLNEMLDPIFDDAEAQSQAISSSREARDKYAPEIEAVLEALGGTYRAQDWTGYDNERLMHDAQLWPAILQARQSRGIADGDLFADVTHADLRYEQEPRLKNMSVWAQSPDRRGLGEPAWPREEPAIAALRTIGRDPTMPQHMPNSAVDAADEPDEADAPGALEETDDGGPLVDDTILVSKEEVRAQRFTMIVISLARLQRLEQTLPHQESEQGAIGVGTWTQKLKLLDRDGRYLLRWTGSWLEIVLF